MFGKFSKQQKVRVNVDGKYSHTVKFTPSKVAKFPTLERLSRKIHNKIPSYATTNH